MYTKKSNRTLDAICKLSIQSNSNTLIWPTIYRYVNTEKEYTVKSSRKPINVFVSIKNCNKNQAEIGQFIQIRFELLVDKETHHHNVLKMKSTLKK